MRKYPKSILTVLIVLLCIPIVLVVGAVLFSEKYYAWVALCVAVLSCVPLFHTFEKARHSTAELTVIAVMIAVSAIGRCVFAWLPAFKPVTAVVVIAGVWLSKESGFAVGALSALISNFYFGQGPWTPFQMFAWGFLGFLAGVLASPLKRHRGLLVLYGIFAGGMYSLAMDVWATLWTDGEWLWSKYVALTVTSLPMTVVYAVSNVIFLLLLAKPIGEKLQRINTKYGLFASDSPKHTS